MSIVRVGLAETQSYSDGWDSIFSKGGTKPSKPKAGKKPAKKAATAKPKPKPKKSKK